MKNKKTLALGYLVRKTPASSTFKTLYRKVPKFSTPENFAVIYLNSKKEAKSWGILSKKMQIE